MAKTVISGTTAYCTAAQVVVFFDWRTLARLLSDTTTPLASSAAVQADANLAALLKAASGRLEAACFRGGRYTTADLAALTSSYNGGQFLAKLVAGLTVSDCYERRPDPGRKLPDLAVQAEALIKQLEEGEAIFPFQETADAGVVSHQTITQAQIAARRDKVWLQQRYRGIRAYEDADGAYAS